VRCHQHAFQAFGGVARECWYDFVPGNKIVQNGSRGPTPIGEGMDVAQEEILQGLVEDELQTSCVEPESTAPAAAHAGRWRQLFQPPPASRVQGPSVWQLPGSLPLPLHHRGTCSA
jgi:hypothetical protein